jgi:hypothetical protein
MPERGVRGRMAARASESEMAALLQEYTGLDAAGVRAALRSGSTLAGLITANGRTVEDFTAAATAIFEAEQAERLAGFQERLTAMLNGAYREARGGGPRGRGPAHIGGPETAALVQEYTGLDAAGLRAALRSGSTLAALITANGRTVEDFTAAATAIFEARQAERLARFEERLNAMLNGESRGAVGGRRGGMRPGEGRGHRGGAPVTPVTPVTPVAPGIGT